MSGPYKKCRRMFGKSDSLSNTEAKQRMENKRTGLCSSGKNESFASGAVRDAGRKPALDLISPLAEDRLGDWLRMGAERYAPRNWERGIPQMRCIASLKRHINRYIRSDQDEDHLAAIMCNAMFLLHNDEAMKLGILPKELDDRPDYHRRTK